ncbi:MAG TPA: hypothetical protein VKV73_00610 [Chloroflexota bacterium]|nr:hypothetical protein [Chloroflexota bacterium]
MNRIHLLRRFVGTLIGVSIPAVVAILCAAPTAVEISRGIGR